MAGDLAPMPRQGLSIWKSIRFYIKAVYTNRLISFLMWGYRRRTKAFWAERSPTRILTYPARPALKTRVFQPPTDNTRNNTDLPRNTPIFFLIHGGGWVFGSPSMDDEQAHCLSTKHGFCVMSLDYSMAPRHRFPAAIYDLEFLIQSILDDKALVEDLNLDTRKVVVGGFSAGGTMTLSLAQLPSIHDRVHALVSFYPLTDATGENRDSVISTTAWGKTDQLPDVQPLYDWAYIPTEQNMRDSLLSPLFATREQISHPVFFITAEKDVLSKEGWLLARGLAGLKTEGDVDIAEAWDENGVRYRCAEGMPHCFTHFWETIRTNEEWENKRIQTNERIWNEVAAWSKSVL